MNKILDNLISLAGQYNNMLSYSMIARELEKHEEISPKDVKAIYGQLSNSGVNIVEYDEALDMVNLSDIKIEEEGPGEEDILALEAEQQGYADSDLDDIVKLYFKDMSKLELIDFSDENKLGERIYKAREAKEFVAFIADQGAEQCGFCNPGFVMNAIALFRENPQPDENEIKEYLSGNLCRCSGYEGQLRGILNFLEWKNTKEFKGKEEASCGK